MSAFTDSSTGGFCLTNLGPVWELAEGQIEETESGWDSLPLVYLCRNPAASLPLMLAQWPVGLKLPGLNFWVQRTRIRPLKGDLWSAELECKGIANPKGWKYRLGSAASEFTLLEESETTPEVIALEATVTLEAERLIIDGVPLTSQVGIQNPAMPDFIPAVRDPNWPEGTTRHTPYGWVLMGCDGEHLTGVLTAWLERRQYQYVHERSP